jgi:DoxX-like protein
VSLAWVVVALVTAAVNGGMGVADLARARFVLANSESVGVPARWVPWLGGLKLAGAAGLVVGVLAWPPLGVLAAAGLVLFFVGAIVTHVRARVLGNLYFPGGYLALAVASLVLGVAVAV